jgi:uncharacterized membrane protein
VEEKGLGPAILPEHIEDTIRSIADLQKRHHEDATPQQRFINKLTALTARPWLAVALLFSVFGWIAANALAAHAGFSPLDPAPFSWLQVVTSVTSLFVVVLVLVAQRHEDELSRHRELLTLELAILSEQKTAKVIQLLEEVRRDNPLIRNRSDPQAEVMSQAADPRTVLEAIKDKANSGRDPSVPDPGA